MGTADRQAVETLRNRVFRNWRQFLVRSSAEFGIVVLGVTMALWADGCVSERADRVEEEARLFGLRDNVSETVEEIRAERSSANGAIEAIRELLTAASEEDVQEATVRYAFWYGAAFSPELNVYDDLKNSGELALLTSSDLRNALARMDTRIRQVEFAQSDLLTVQQLNVDTYMIEHVDMQRFIGEQLGVPTGQAAEVDLAFVDDREFRNRMLMKLDLVLQLEQALADAEEALVEVDEQIEAQLPDGYEGTR